MKLASAGKSWYVARCSPQREAKAEHELRQAGFDVYLPRYRKDVQNRRTRTYVTREYCLIPSYLFVAVPNGDFGNVWKKCKHINQRHPFVGVDDVPARVSGADVERLQIMETDMQFDDTRAARIHRKEEAKTRKETLEMKYKPGREVTINSGPLAEFAAIVQEVTKHGDVKVVIRLFGSERSIEVEAEHLSTAA